MLHTGISLKKPTFIRYPRGNGIGTKLKSRPALLRLGKANVIQEGELLCIWALGNFVEVAKQISDSIFSIYGFKPTIVDPRFVKPLDEKLLREHCSNHKGILTLEDNVLAGGFGAAVLESLDLLNLSFPAKRIGWPDQFIEHGSSVNSLRERYDLDFTSIFEEVEFFLKELKIEQKSLAI
jgi:1-deoxy-D-xylulose-5-phosphate synthase